MTETMHDEYALCSSLESKDRLEKVLLEMNPLSASNDEDTVKRMAVYVCVIFSFTSHENARCI